MRKISDRDWADVNEFVLMIFNHFNKPTFDSRGNEICFPAEYLRAAWPGLVDKICGQGAALANDSLKNYFKRVDVQRDGEKNHYPLTFDVAGYLQSQGYVPSIVGCTVNLLGNPGPGGFCGMLDLRGVAHEGAPLKSGNVDHAILDRNKSLNKSRQGSISQMFARAAIPPMPALAIVVPPPGPVIVVPPLVPAIVVPPPVPVAPPRIIIDLCKSPSPKKHISLGLDSSDLFSPPRDDSPTPSSLGSSNIFDHSFGRVALSSSKKRKEREEEEGEEEEETSSDTTETLSPAGQKKRIMETSSSSSSSPEEAEHRKRIVPLSPRSPNRDIQVKSPEFNVPKASTLFLSQIEVVPADKENRSDYTTLGKGKGDAPDFVSAGTLLPPAFQK